MNLAQILEYVVYYAPVALFLLFVFWGLIVGLIRGFRKSLILFIQALAAAGICVGIFYFLVNNASTDKWVYDISSKWVDYNKLLETTTEYTCIKDVLVDAILKNQDYGTTFALMLEENGAYLDTLVNLAYRIVLFVVLLVVFFVLVFLFYLVYFFFYPERRKKAKCRARERLGNGNGYHKHTFFGGLVGAFRGAIVGLVWLSFIGALFFIVAGGEGDNRPEDYPDYTFTDDSLNEAYSTYKVVGSYGSRGIFRILNTVKDQENVPFYLFAANMVLSGNLNVEESNIHTTVRFTKEIANYTSFANSTIKLILKYDKDKEIISAINSQDSNKLLDLMNKLMEDENFQQEYDQLIESFNAGTYFINFGLSFINSIVTHRNELKFTDDLDQQVIDLMDIIFDGEHKITVSSLLTEGDARQLMKSVVSVLSVNTTIDETTSEQRKALLYSKVLIPEILKLSIFKDPTRKDTFNPLLEDLYNYLSTNVVLNSNVSSSNINLAKAELNLKQAVDEAKQTGIDWIAELSSFLDVSMDLIEIAETVIDDVSEPINLIFNIFPDDNEEIKNSNLTHFNNLIDGLSNSKLLDTVLSMTVIRDAIDNSLMALSSNIKLPSKINYANVYDASGKVTSYGEIYVLLTALKELVLTENTKTIVNSLVDGDFNASMIKTIAEVFLHETEGKEDETILDLSLKSTVLNYIISGVFLGFADAEDTKIKIIVPSNLCNVDSEEIVTIKKEELETLFTSLIGALDILKEDNQVDFKKVVENVDNLADSQIIEASVVYLLVDMLKDVDAVSIPEMYKNAATIEVLKGDFTENIWYTKNEISNIIYAFDELLNISGIDEFDINNALDSITDHIGSLNESSLRDAELSKLDVAYKSAIIRSTFKELITDNVTSEFIDTSILNSTLLIEDIDGVSSIKKSEVATIIDSFNELEIDFKNIDVASITNKVTGLNDSSIKDPSKSKLDILYRSNLIKYVLVKQMDKVITDELMETAVRDSNSVKEIEIIDGNTYYYYQEDEIKYLINSVKELEITNFDSIDGDAIKNKVLDLNGESVTDNSKSKLGVLYSSTIIKFIVSKQMDNVIEDELMPTEVRDSEEVKDYLNVLGEQYGYYKEDEIKYLINSVKELEITDIDNINTDAVKGNILNLNGDAITSSGTKLDVLYSSAIIKFAIAEQMDAAITEDLVKDNIKNSSEVKEYINVSGEQYGYYKEDEIKYIIDSLNELEINLDSVDGEAVKGKVLELNGDSTTNIGSTKLDVLYSSAIIKFAIADQMDAAITNELIKDDIKNSTEVKEYINLSGTPYGYYQKNEIKYIIDSLNELEINLDSINGEAVKGKVLDLNDNSTTNIGSTKLDVLYSSIIIKFVIADQMDSVITTDLTPTEVRDSENVKEFIDLSGTSYGYYIKAEVASIIDSLPLVGITTLGTDINTDLIKGEVLNLNDKAYPLTTDPRTKLDVLYDSVVIKFAISKQLDIAITTSIVSEDVIDSTQTKDTIDVTVESVLKSYKYYLEPEVAAIINSLKDLGITNIDDISVDNIKGKVGTLNGESNSVAGETKLDVLYSSTIIKYALSDRLEEVFTGSSLNVNSAVLAKAKTDDEKTETNNEYYLKAEVAKLVAALNKGLGIDDLDDTSSINANTALGLNEKPTGMTETKLHIIYKSDIMAYILTDKLEAAISSNPVLVDDSDAKAKYLDTDVYLYQETELSILIKALDDLHITDINTIDSSSIALNNTTRDNILASIILFDSVSQLIIDNDTLVKPNCSLTENTAHDVTKLVNDDEMSNILNLLIALNVTNVSSNVNISLNDTNNGYIVNSFILRATVSKNVIDNSNINVATANLDSEITDKDVITVSEMTNLLKAITDGLGISNISGITSTISLPGKNDANLDNKIAAISASQIIRATITKKLDFKDKDDNTIAIRVLADDTDVLTQINSITTNDLLAIKEAEMSKLIKAIIVGLGGDDSTATGGQITVAKLKALNTADLNTFLESSTIALLTDKLLNKPTVIAAYALVGGTSLDSDNFSIYNLEYAVYTPIVEECLTVDCQKDMISKISG